MIYFVRSIETGHIKIGASNNIRQRFAQLNVEHGKLEVLGFLPGGFPFEKALHMAFAEYCVEGMGREWFHDCGAIQKYITKYAKPLEQVEVKPRIVVRRPHYRRGVNFYLYEQIMKKRQEPGYEEFGIEELAQATSIPAERLERLMLNTETHFISSDMDELCDYFRCKFGELCKVNLKPYPRDLVDQI